MNDRELLEMAAKAAGYQIHVWGTKGNENVARMDVAGQPRWNPLADDGDALRLAVKLHLALSCGSHMKRSWADRSDIGPFFGNWDMHGGDESKAMRYAITRAAAEIGKAMP